MDRDRRERELRAAMRRDVETFHQIVRGRGMQTPDPPAPLWLRLFALAGLVAFVWMLMSNGFRCPGR